MKSSALMAIKLTLATSGIVFGAAVMSHLPQLFIQLTYELGWATATPM